MSQIDATVGLDWNVLLDCIACIRQYLLDGIAGILESRLLFNLFHFIWQYGHVALCYVVKDTNIKDNEFAQDSNVFATKMVKI